MFLMLKTGLGHTFWNEGTGSIKLGSLRCSPKRATTFTNESLQMNPTSNHMKHVLDFKLGHTYQLNSSAECKHHSVSELFHSLSPPPPLVQATILVYRTTPMLPCKKWPFWTYWEKRVLGACGYPLQTPVPQNCSQT